MDTRVALIRESAVEGFREGTRELVSDFIKSLKTAKRPRAAGSASMQEIERPVGREDAMMECTY